MNEQRLQKLLQMHAEDEQDTFVVFGIAMEYLGSGNIVAAESWFNKVLAIDNKHIASYYQLALLLLKREYPAEATALLEQGLILLKASKDYKTRNEFQSLLDEINF